ncbi:MAG TPA: response regulator transcription factor [Planctomycetota bacterium]|nr:response regulator transcription factor [Planctomycetota bacterium]
MAKPITILLADSQRLVREALAALLHAEPDMSVVAQVENAGAALEAAMRLGPDVVCLAIGMSGGSTFEAARALRARSVGIRILLLDDALRDQNIEEALAVEASGYITREEGAAAFVEAVRRVESGGMYVPPRAVPRIVIESGGPRYTRSRSAVASTLTPREIEVLRHVARGLSKKEIAKALHLSWNTINRHAAKLMAKLEIHDRVELTRFAIREGLVDL